MNRFVAIDIEQLRVGMFVQLETGWLHHPFPVNSFKITTVEQLAQLRSLQFSTIQVDLSRSDPLERASEKPANFPSQPKSASSEPRRGALAWRDSILNIQSQFLGAVSRFDDVQALLPAHPERARLLSDELITAQVVRLAQARDLSLHLLTDAGGTSLGIHGVNVAVLSLLVGKTLGLQADSLQDLGVAGLLHDIGKYSVSVSASQCALNQGLETSLLRDSAYARHVGASVALTQAMSYGPAVTTAIAQHHEWADGSGFPLGLLAQDMDMAGQILALVNNFERMCNPPEMGGVMTPHEAISVLYGQFRHRYAPEVLKAFVQTLGVFPPGSLVELSDGRIGVVVSVNTSQSLKPQVLVCDVNLPQELQQLNLQEHAGLGIRRGLTRHQLPRNALELLQPYKKFCYFFDSVSAASEKGFK